MSYIPTTSIRNGINPIAYFSDEEEDTLHLAKKQYGSFCHDPEHVLLSISAVFPFVFFPVKMTIDESKVNIIIYDFFWSFSIESIDIKNIKDISVATIPFFGTIKMIVDQYDNNPIMLPFFKKKEALEARKLIQGLKSMHLNNIKLDRNDISSFRTQIEEVGRTWAID